MSHMSESNARITRRMKTEDVKTEKYISLLCKKVGRYKNISYQWENAKYINMYKYVEMYSSVVKDKTKIIHLSQLTLTRPVVYLCCLTCIEQLQSLFKRI